MKAIWIVGICYADGEHEYHCFDDNINDALGFARANMAHKVYMWDMMSDRTIAKL